MTVSFLSPSLYWVLNLGVCQLYPGYKTFSYLYMNQLRKSNTSDKPHLKTVYYAHHFVYWTLYFLYTYLESLLPLSKLVPFYYEFRLLFFFWLGSDHFKGAGYLFHRYLNKLFLEVATFVNRHFEENYEEKTKTMLSDLLKNLGTLEELNLGKTQTTTQTSESEQFAESKKLLKSVPFDESTEASE